jgi:hypothetical protein
LRNKRTGQKNECNHLDYGHEDKINLASSHFWECLRVLDVSTVSQAYFALQVPLRKVQDF